jgi:hypothetical protein
MPYHCTTWSDTVSVAKPSSWFPGQTMLGFCPACTPAIDVAMGRYHRLTS